MRFLLRPPPLLTACNCTGCESSDYSCKLTHFSTQVRKFAGIIPRKEETGSTGAVAPHHKSSTTWEVWTLSALGVLMLLLLTFYVGLTAMKRRKRKAISVEYGHGSPCKSAPVLEEAVVEDEGRRSEMVFFVEEEEWFGLDELLGGVADLRMQGFCSSLYTVQLRNSTVYAVKRLKKMKVPFEEFGLTMRRIGNLRHPNILPLVCYNSDLDEKLLIYRFQRNGSLLNLFENYIEGKRAFSWKLRLSLALGTARGLEFIHHKMIIPHGNIKLSNIMLNDNEEPMISEYGYAEFVEPGVASLSTKGYAAPEKSVSQKSDVYSFGVVLLELLTGKIVEKSGLDLPRWVGSVVTEECAGEVFDEEIFGVEMYAFPLLNLALKCAAHHPDERPDIGEVVGKIQEVANAQGDVSKYDFITNCNRESCIQELV